MAEIVGTVGSAIAVTELAAKVVLRCAQYWKDVSNAREDIARIEKEVTNLKTVTEGVRQLCETPRGARLHTTEKLHSALKDGEVQLKGLQESLGSGKEKAVIRRLGIRSLRWPFQSKDVEKIVDGLARCTQTLSQGLQVDEIAITLDIDRKAVLDRIPIAQGAAFDSYAQEHNVTCLPETRVELLREINEWIQNPKAEAVFWLNGMAGTGKSTISRTIATSAVKGGYYGASFFFKRGEGDRGGASKIFPTLAAQLVSRAPALTPHIQAVIDSDPLIFGKTKREQYEKLILEPFSRISGETYKDRTVLLIVDALDECEDEEDVRLLIHLFSSSKEVQSPRLKIFLTSRPELPIRLGFAAIKNSYQGLILHEVAEPVIEHDIQAFLKHELGQVRDEYNSSVPEDRHLPVVWPSEADMQTLVKMAVPLFIFAATVCRFVADRRLGDPGEHLQDVISYRATAQDSKLDATYLPVLNKLTVGLSSKRNTEMIERFQDVVGSIVSLANPLSVSSLARLLNTPEKMIHPILDLLHSVLSVPPSSADNVRLLHLSFRDFLVDPDRRGTHQFWVDEQIIHTRLAAGCLRVMSETLQIDICELRDPGAGRSDVDAQKLGSKLGAEVQYACRYWAYHAVLAQDQISDGDDVHIFLTCHFLHWLEALSLLDRLSESLETLDRLKTRADPNTGKGVLSFLDDARRFVSSTLSTIQIAPLQVYSSCLLFAPNESVVRTTYEKDIASWISLQPRVDNRWNQCQQTIEGHKSPVKSVAFSPDGLLVASASGDRTVKIWSAATGVCQQTLEGHYGRVESVAFSNNHVVASGARDRTVRIWSTSTGACLHTFDGHTEDVVSVACSSDGQLASASWDGTVKTWSTTTGACLRTLEGHGAAVYSVAFSPDGRWVASASVDKTVKIWSTVTGVCQRTLEGHVHPVSSVAFSDGQIASASQDDTVKIWSSITGACLQTLEGHSDGVMSVAFSPDGLLVASASIDCTVKIWSTVTGTHRQTLEGNGFSVYSVAFAPDGQRVATGTEDNTVRIWSATTTDSFRQTVESHTNWVKSVAISPDGLLVASASDDTTVKIWSAVTGMYRQTLEGHSDAVTVVVFSPDSQLVASGSHDRTTRIWSVAGWACLHTLQGHSERVKSIAFSSDSQLIVSGSSGKTTKVWSVATGICQQTFELVKEYNWSVAFSPDGELVASADDDVAHIWSIATGTCLCTLGHGCSRINSAAFSPDGLLVAAAFSDHIVKIWSATTGSCQAKVDMGEKSEGLSFSRDGSSILTDGGSFAVESLLREAETTSLDLVPAGQESQRHRIRRRFGYGVSPDHSWIQLNGKRLLWLPAGFRPVVSNFAISGSVVTIGCPSGRVVVMRFSAEGLLE